MSNNINQQNFASQDLLGVTSGGRGGAANNFLVGNQGGISTTHATGLNYIDTWGKKKRVKIAASYFFNYTDNTTLTSLSRKYYNSGETSSLYNENDSSRSINQNHRANLRIEYIIDSMNTLIFTPKFSYQQNSQLYGLAGQSIFANNEISRTVTDQHNYNAGYNISGDVLFQHKFPERDRTISINIGSTINIKGSNNIQNSLSYYDTTNSYAPIDQHTLTSNKSYSVNASISYTEPAGKSGMMQKSTTHRPIPSIDPDKELDSLNRNVHTYSLLDTSLSNKYSNDYMTQRGGVTYRFKNDMLNMSVGVNGQYALLTGTNVFPFPYSTTRTFYSILPNAVFNFKFKNTTTLRIQYRTSTSPPSISQLQSVINNSNPLLLSTGNPLSESILQ
jgi:hypothetical protein